MYWLGSAKFTNEAAYLNRKLAAFWGTNNSDHQARICHSTTVTGVANTWGYGAMTNSYNDIRNAKTILVMGGNPAEAHPVSLQHILEGKELNRANMIVVDPRMTRTAAHATEYVRVRPGTHIADDLRDALAHFRERLGGQGIHPPARLRHRRHPQARSAKWPPDEVERVTGLPEAQVKRVAEIFAKQKPATLIWAMGQTQFTTGTANVRASCILLLATGNVGHAGGGANIFRGHTNVQGATDLGLDVTTLPLYYGLAEEAWRHWCRVWEVDYDWMRSRFADKKLMETPGIPSTRWFDATLLPKDQVSQPDTVQAMFIMGHGVNTITRMPEAVRGIEKLELLVVCDPYPTAWSVLSERKNGTYLLPACTSFEMDGSRTASNRSLQWGEQIVKPVFESKNDYDVMYMLARKLGFADRMFKNIKVENGAVSAEDILREINRGGWSTGYCGQSPERLKAHMKNQAKFDLVTLRAPKDDPEVGGDYYGLPWPCWGTPEFRHPGTPDPLQHQSAGEGRRRHLPRPVRRRARRQAQGDGERAGGRKGGARQPARRRLLFGRLGNQGRLSRVHARRAEEARLGQGPHRAGNGDHPAGQSPPIPTPCPGRSIFPAASSAWRSSTAAPLRQRQGAHGRLESARSRSRSTANRSTRRGPISCAEYPTLPDAQQFRVPNIGFTRAEGRGRQRHRQSTSR